MRTAERFQYYEQEVFRRRLHPRRYLLAIISGIQRLRDTRFESWVTARYVERFESEQFEKFLKSAIVTQAQREKEHEEAISSIFEHMDEEHAPPGLDH
jgi:hypothetical protein